MLGPQTQSPPVALPRAGGWRRLLSSSLLSERAIVLSTIVVAGGFFGSKVLGLVREILIAREFGTSAQLDAFRAANSFSDFLDSVVAGATIAAVFIPVLSGHLVKDERSRREGWRFASAVLNDMFLFMLTIAGLGIVFAPQLVQYVVAPGFPPAQSALTASLMQVLLISAVVFGVGGTVTGILHAHSRFTLAALAPMVHNLGIIAALYILVPQFGIFGLAYGVVIGSVLYLAVQIPGLIRSRMQYSLTLGRRQRSMRELLRLLGPRVVTTNVVQVTRLVTVSLASFLGEGSISALGYAYQIWQFPETLIGTAIAVAVFPRLAARAAEGNRKEFKRLYDRSLFSILAMAIPAALTLVFFAQPIVTLLLQRGAFDADSTALTAQVLQFYALAVVGESLLELTARVFYAQHDSKTPMFAALGTMALRIALMIWWRGIFGAPGLALAYAVSVLVEGSALWWLARRRFGIASATQVE